MILLYYIVFILYEEVLYKIFAATNFYLSIFSAIFYYLFIAGILALITNLFSNSGYKHFLRIISFILSFWYGACILVKRTFNITLSLSATSMADQFLAGGFIDTTIKVIIQNWYVVILVLLPFIFSFLFTAYYNKKELVIKKLPIHIIVILSCYYC